VSLNAGATRLTDVLQPGSDPIEATFELNDTLYAKAHIPPTEEVYLWLGVCLLGSGEVTSRYANSQAGQCHAVISNR
jgi:hypothetical protein